VAQEALAMLGVDESGLDKWTEPDDRLLLDKYAGGRWPGNAGVHAQRGEDAIEEMYEPY